MIITLQAKLLLTEEQAVKIAATQQRYVQLCNAISQIAHKTGILSQFQMYREYNNNLRAEYGNINTHFHACARIQVASAYRSRRTNDTRRVKNGRKPKKHVKPCAWSKNASVDYNKCLWSISRSSQSQSTLDLIEHINRKGNRCSSIKLSIATLDGRIHVDALLPNAVLYKGIGQWKQATLVYKKESREWYFYIAVEMDEPQLREYNRYIGIDLGITNIATTSEGEIYSGKDIDNKRLKHCTHVRKLQKKNTRSARKRLIQIRRRMSYFIRTTNHTISKQIVVAAQRTSSCIVLEELKYIFESLKARKQQRQRMFGWSFAQLRDFIYYKAKMLGVRVISVDPKYSSQTCRVCGHTERVNRKGELFRCKRCDHVEHADLNAATNIAMLGMLADHCEEQGLPALSFDKVS